MVEATLALWLEELGDNSEIFTDAISILEQSMRFYIKNDRFPKDYFELQETPSIKRGFLTFAGDDGGNQGKLIGFVLKMERFIYDFALLTKPVNYIG